MAQFEVRWATHIENVDSFATAAKEAWASLIQTLMSGQGATVIVVDELDEAGERGAGVAFDMTIPWYPDIVATHHIEEDDPRVYSKADKAEAEILQKKYDQLNNKRQEEFMKLFDNGGLVN